MVTARGNVDDSSGLMVIVCRFKFNDAGLLYKHIHKITPYTCVEYFCIGEQKMYVFQIGQVVSQYSDNLCRIKRYPNLAC